MTRVNESVEKTKKQSKPIKYRKHKTCRSTTKLVEIER